MGVAANKPNARGPVAPDGIPEAAVAFWRSIVSDLQPDYFLPSDLPLLSAYCRALAAHDHARSMLESEGPVRQDGKASAWLVIVEKEVRAVVALAARLRLAPQSRMDRTVAGKTARPTVGMRPWERSGDDEELLA